MDYVSYEQLPMFETGERYNWGIFGNNDHLGTLNFITPEAIRAASQLVTMGHVVCLSLPLNLPNPPLSRERRSVEHHVEVNRSGRDDKLDNFYLQGSSQWDGLAHIRYREFGYYGGRQDHEVNTGELGIDWMARRGIIGRAILVDFEEYFASRHEPLVPDHRTPLGPKEIEDVLSWSGTSINPGDILVFRTGWLKWYLALDYGQREALQGRLNNSADGIECAGLAPGAETAGWLWNNKVAAVAADNPTVETLRIRVDEGFLHRRILALLGMPIGEFWFLEELSKVCRTYGRWHFFLTSAPLNLIGGVGSPNNAYAIF